MFDKNADDRLTECYICLVKVLGDPNRTMAIYHGAQSHSLYTAREISRAIALGGKPSTRSKEWRTRLRTLLLVRIVCGNAALGDVPRIRAQHLGDSESQLEGHIRVAAAAPAIGSMPQPKPVSAPVDAFSYGISSTVLANATTALAPARPQRPPRLRPDVKQQLSGVSALGTVADKIDAFALVTQPNVVLSGHGSWVQAATPQPLASGTREQDGWRWVQLKPGQELRFYVAEYYPLGNAVGQRIDNHQNVPVVETVRGGAWACDYLLHPKDRLTLLNHSKFDRRFITVSASTPLSHFVGLPEYANAVFHWAACRVVFNAAGEQWDPGAQRWSR